MTKQLRAAVAGVGFIGQVHVRAARLSGAEVVGVAGGSPDRTRATASKLGVDRVFDSSEELVTSPDVDVVHICTPNNLHEPLARLAIDQGKHVICEKPLATTVEAAASLVEAARGAGVVAAVPFVYRFHPVVREARARVSRGETGRISLIHGSYQQDWLASADDYNWRVDPSRGGESRAFADIGSHWCDLIEFVTGHRITRLSARTVTAIPERVVDDAAAFEKASGSGERVHVQGEDAVTMVFQTDQGASGTVVVSQVSHGRKNRLWFELDAANEAIVFDQEHAEQLWIGRRDASTTVVRDPNTLSPEAAQYAWLPAGHAQSYADCFEAFVRDTYSTVNGDGRDGLPLFADGLRAATITQAVLDSSHDDSWKEVR